VLTVSFSFFSLSAYEILFSDVQLGTQITDGATKLTGVEWNTWTCTLGITAHLTLYFVLIQFVMYFFFVIRLASDWYMVGNDGWIRC
jgi:hypothetical protein